MRHTTWTLIKLYWQSEQRGFAYVALLSVLLFTLFLIGLEVALSYWYNYFYDALQAYDKKSVLDLLAVFFFIAGLLIILSVYRFYIQKILGLRWRRWLTQHIVDQWLVNKNYYYLENFDNRTDNPDQRIQEDIAALVDTTLSLAVGFLSAFVLILVFSAILWSLSGTLKIPLGFTTLHMHGYLLWVGIIYAVIGTYLTHRIGRPLIHLNFEQQRREADFRFASVDLRSHAEHVALYAGEAHEKNSLMRLFDSVLENCYFIILREKLLLWFTAGYNQLSTIIPLVIALPNYFNKIFKLGGLIQTLQAFGKMQASLSFIVDSYTVIASWKAVSKRLLTFLNHIQEIESLACEKNKFKREIAPDSSIQINNLTLNLPKGEKLLHIVNQQFIQGKHYLVKGVSGIGKSTFVRAVAGIWPFGSGCISLPAGKKIMYVPQKPYMPLGNLKEALIFPDKNHFSDDTLKQALIDCHLSHLISRLEETAHWSQILSPGEQQRIAFARILIHQPDWVFLDESTSALDIENEKNLYELIKKQLPHCSVISIGHRNTLDAYHDELIYF